MAVSLTQITITIAVAIVLIVILTTRFKIHAFFALLLSCAVVGLGLNMSFTHILEVVQEGFGAIIGSLGLIIVFGTALGLILESTGATLVLANAIIKIIGNKRAGIGMNAIGYLVGLPIFCDSGYIVLSSLNNTIVKRSGKALAFISVSLASGLYAVHNLIPPHPGPSAAAIALSADFGKVILYGLIVAIPTSLSGFLWAKHASKSMLDPMEKEGGDENVQKVQQKLPNLWMAVLPILIPIFLIGLRSFMEIDAGSSFLYKIIDSIGTPEGALAIGILLALLGNRDKNNDLKNLLGQSVTKAGDILLIIGAGGALGALIAEADIADHLAGNNVIENMGIVFPFLVATILKTAQGSSSVAIITTATMVASMLASLGLESEMDRILAVLAIGAGSIMVSHANDSYFWVVSRFSKIKMGVMLRVYTMATLIMGIIAFAVIYLLYLML